jgi:hypothetical protein
LGSIEARVAYGPSVTRRASASPVPGLAMIYSPTPPTSHPAPRPPFVTARSGGGSCPRPPPLLRRDARPCGDPERPHQHPQRLPHSSPATTFVPAPVSSPVKKGGSHGHCYRLRPRRIQCRHARDSPVPVSVAPFCASIDLWQGERQAALSTGLAPAAARHPPFPLRVSSLSLSLSLSLWSRCSAALHCSLASCLR